MARTISNISAFSNELHVENTKLVDLDYELSNVKKIKHNLSVLYFVGFAAALVGLFI